MSMRSSETVWLDNSRIIAIFAVVLLHTGCEITSHNGIETTRWLFGAIYDALSRWCVPVFLMISGALLLDAGKKEDLATFYRKRMSRILIPVLFWSAFFVMWAYVQSVRRGEPLPWDYLMGNWLNGEPYYHMWFMYMIVFLYLFTPVFRTIVANTNDKELLFFTCAAFVLAGINVAYSSMHDGRSKIFANWFLLYIPYYFAGYLIRKYSVKASGITLSVSALFFTVLTFAGYYFVGHEYGINRGEYFYDYLSITVVPTSICLMFLFKKWNRPLFGGDGTKKVSSLILGVYLVHPLMIEQVTTIECLGFKSLDASFAVPVFAALVFVLSLLLAWMISLVPYLRRTI